MRLLFLNPLASMGGAERVLHDIIANVRRARPAWHVGLLVGQDGPLVDDVNRIGVKADVVPFPRELARLGDSSLTGGAASTSGRVRFMGRALGGSVSALAYRRRLRQAVARFDPDVLHTNGPKMHLFGASVRPPRAALIWHLHDYLSAHPVASRLLRPLGRRCNAVAAVSESVGADARRQLGPRVDIIVLRNTVDLQRFTPEGPRLDLDALAGLPAAESGTLRIGLVATFARWKGHLTFLDALRPLASAGKVRGYVIGGPQYETDGSQCSVDELKAAAGRLGLGSSVGFTGFVADPAAALRALDIVVHASTSPEPFGLVIAEAMAAGRPVVVSYAGGAAELIAPEHDALAHPPGDARELTRQLERLVADPSLRRRLSAAARQSAEARFDPARASDEVLRLYERVTRESAECSLQSQDH